MTAPHEWPFCDDPSSGAYTVEAILSGSAPILSVLHDVSDGAWQFLTGKEGERSPSAYVPLRDILRLDPTLAELADMPVGCAAFRSQVTQPWVREPTFPSAWEELLTHGYAYTEMQQARLRDEFELLKWERFEYEAARDRLTLSDGAIEGNADGKTKERCLVTRASIIGTIASASHTWQWAWDDPTMVASAAVSSTRIRDFGQAQGFQPLTLGTWSADDVDGWEMATIACLLLRGRGVYRAPHETSAIYLVLHDPRLETVSGD